MVKHPSAAHTAKRQRERREAQGPHSSFEGMLPVMQMSSLGPTSYRFYCLSVTPRLLTPTLAHGLWGTLKGTIHIGKFVSNFPSSTIILLV